MEICDENPAPAPFHGDDNRAALRTKEKRLTWSLQPPTICP